MNYDGLLTFLPKASNLFDLICFYFCTSVVLPCLVAIFFIGGTLLFEEVNTFGGRLFFKNNIILLSLEYWLLDYTS